MTGTPSPDRTEMHGNHGNPRPDLKEQRRKGRLSRLILFAPKSRPVARHRHVQNLRAQHAERLICTAKRKQMAGGYDDRTGDGHCFGGGDRRGPWMWHRDIKRGQWSGPWRRVHEDEE